MKFITQEEPIQHRQFQLESRMEEVEKVLTFVSAVVPKCIVLNCQTVMVEGFVNVVKHAHKDLPPETLVLLEICTFSAWVELRIWDYGPAFDWEKVLAEKLANPPGLYDTSGRGVLWIYKFMDQVEYKRVDDARNCLIMYKEFCDSGSDEDCLVEVQK